MIDKIMNSDCIKEKPPVLVDVGASGDIHGAWSELSKYSVCLAFDPDDRDLSISKTTGGKFREFYLMNRIVSDSDGLKKFNLTKSPHCSSVLETNMENLGLYNISSYFEIKKTIELPAVTINSALNEIGYSYIDWFKTDSQGTDLRIFANIDDKILEKVLVAEFEPGIMDAYHGEDKLYDIMKYFDSRNFWCDECEVKGMSRLKESFIEKNFNSIEKRYSHFFQKPSAFWVGISYMNQMKLDKFDERDFLLMIVFAIVKKQFGFAIELAEVAEQKFENKLFGEVKRYSLRQMRIGGYLKLSTYILGRIFKKLYGN